MTVQQNISIETLRQLLTYNPETGELFWKSRPLEMFSEGRYSRERQKKTFNARFAGRPAFNYIDKEGYRRGAIMGQSIRAHTVVWALLHGEWPKDRIDHKHQVRHRNLPDDLRGATSVENGRNQCRHKNNTSGFKGVYWSEIRKKWVAQITIEYKGYNLGGFNSAEEAHAAYVAKATEVFGEFARFD